jgi:cyclic pyranopterin monophosphate synthase
MTRMSHIDDSGVAKMVDVSAKPQSVRIARARGTITMEHTTLEAIRANTLKKGDVLGVAKIAGIMAAKRTSEMIPLCHPIGLTDVGVDFSIDESLPGVQVETHARTTGQTGVEMEALTAATIALLTIYDMAKAIDREMTIGGIMLVEKSGGASGRWRKGEATGD